MPERPELASVIQELFQLENLSSEPKLKLCD
jgi:hypothetical protein